MKPGARKAPRGGWLGAVVENRRAIWVCSHDGHDTKHAARLCGRRQIRAWERARTTRPGKVAGANGQRASTLPPPKPGPLAGPLVFRRSYVEDFLQCTEHQPGEDGNAAFGGAVHDAVQAYLRACIQSGEQSRLSLLPELIKGTLARNGGVHPDRFEELAEMVDRFAHTRLASPSSLLWLNGEPCVEYTLRWDAGWCVYTGTCDRIDRDDGDDPYDPPRLITITDYKSQWFKGQHTFQGRFYAALALKIIPSLEGVRVLFDHLPTRSGDVWHPGLVDGHAAYFERGDLDGWFDDVTEIFKRRYEGPRGRPTGSAACQYCGLRYSCAAATLESSVMPEDREQARELVGDWVRKDSSVKAIREGLEAYYKHHKPDVFDGLEVGFLLPRDVRSATYWKASDPTGIAGQLDKMGMDGKSVLTTIVDKKRVPYQLYDALAVAGVARWDTPEPKFKRRKADGKEDEE